MSDTSYLVFDTGPLRHFAREGWLGLLRAVVGDRTAVVPDLVVEELRTFAHSEPELARVLREPWLQQRTLSTDAELARYAEFARPLVHGTRNRGEAAVLALASLVPRRAVLDDGVALKHATRRGIPLTGTLGLLNEAIDNGLLTVDLVSALADDLLRGEYRLPFGAGGFARWREEYWPPSHRPETRASASVHLPS